MSRQCIKCGAEISNVEVFCPKCGTVQNMQKNNASGILKQNPTQMVNASQGASNTKKYVIVGAIVAVVLLVGLFLIGLLGNSNGKKEAPSETIHGDTMPSATTLDSSQIQQDLSNPAAAKAEQELHQKGVQGTVLASSVGHNGSGYLSLVKTNNGQYQIVTYDTKNGRVGITPYDRKLLYFTDRKPQGAGSETVIFNITIQNDIHDNDKNAGAWEGSNHNLPVYAAYKFDGGGNLVPGMLTTGKGVKPSHYQEYLYETRNVDTINLFLTEMMALQKNIADNKVTLP